MRRGLIVFASVLSLLATGLAPALPQEPEPAILYTAYVYRSSTSGSAISTIVPGGEPTRLAGARSFNVEPQWSPDRSRIAYVHHGQPRNPDVWLMDPDGSDKVRLTTGRPDDVYPRWSPDGSHIAWVKVRRSGGSARVYVMHPDGADKMAVSPERHRAAQPEWSPDGRSIAYVHHPRCTDCPGDGEIFVVDGHSPGPARRLTDNDVHEVYPAWSPDGSRIAFARDTGDSADLFTMAPDGSDVRQLTSVDGYAFLPRWSPDGSEIAFTLLVDAENFHTRLGVVDVATGETRLLTDVPTGGIMPDWSPDGTRIAFIGYHSGGHNLGVIDRDGTGATQLTESDADEAWLDW